MDGLSSSLGGRAVFGVLWNTAGKFAGFAVNFAGQLVLVRLILPRDFGVFALALSFFQVVSVFVDGNFPLATIQMHDEPDLGDTAFVLCVAQGVVLFALSWVLSFGVRLYGFQDKELPLLIVCLGARYALAPIAQLYDAQLQKTFRYRRLSMVGFIAGLFSTAAGVVMALSGLGIWSLLGRELLGMMVLVLGYRAVSGVRFHWRFRRDAARKLLRFGRKMLVSSSLIAIFNRMDNFLIGLFFGVSGVGFYSQARYLGDLSQAALASVNVVAFPLYSNLKNEPNKLSRSFQLLNYFIIRLMLPFSILFVLFPGHLISFLFGEKWRPAGEALRGLALYPVLACLFANLESLLTGGGKIEMIAWVRGVRIVCAFGFMGLGAHFYGLGGAALGFTSTYLIGLLAMQFLGERELVNGLWKSLWVPSLAALLSAFCVLALKLKSFQNPSKLEFGTLVLLSLALFVILLVASERKFLASNLRIVMRRIQEHA